jgi:glyoxylase I family protein
MKIEGLHHIAIIAVDYPRSKHFYTEVLGLPILNECYRDERRSYKLDLALPGGIQIELFSFPDAPPRLSYPEASGLRHLALAVSDLDAGKAYLEGHGIVVEQIRTDEITGRRFTFFSDPEGLPLELYEVATT